MAAREKISLKDRNNKIVQYFKIDFDTFLSVKCSSVYKELFFPEVKSLN